MFHFPLRELLVVVAVVVPVVVIVEVLAAARMWMRGNSIAGGAGYGISGGGG